MLVDTPSFDCDARSDLENSKTWADSCSRKVWEESTTRQLHPPN